MSANRNAHPGSFFINILKFLAIFAVFFLFFSVEPLYASSRVSGTISSTVSSKNFSGKPIRVIIPAIGLDSNIVGMGTDQTGALEVPDGDTNNVGWYKRGTIPGNVGSAVFDAHVYAAFENLDDLEEGDKIYVITDKNELLRFSVEDAKTFKLSSLSSKTLFGNQGERGLNLITCAGKLTKDKSTYDHRLVVFTTLENAQSFGQRV